MPGSESKEINTYSNMLSSENDPIRRTQLVDVFIDAQQDPLSVFSRFEFPEGLEERYQKIYDEYIIKLTAIRLNLDPDNLNDADTMTDEFKHEVKVSRYIYEQMRLQKLNDSNYMAAVKHISSHIEGREKSGAYTDIYMTAADPDNKPIDVIRLSVLYFFSQNPGLDPSEQNRLSPDHKAKIIGCFSALDDFYREHMEELRTAQDLLQTYIEVTNPTKAQETLRRINDLAVVPYSRVTPNNKLVNTLTRATRKPEDAIEIIMTVCETGKRNNKTVVTSSCILTYEGDNVKISGRQPFTEFDRNVYDAVCSLYAAGNRVFTSDMVWRAMLERTQQEQPTPAQKAAITKSIDKMRFMRAQIDCSNEFKARRIELNGENVSGAGYDDNLLHLSVTWVTAGKNTIRAYEFPQEARFAPVLYQYSAAVKELITTPVGLLDIKKLDKTGKPTTHSVEYTEQRVIINGYLRRRIEGMKGKNKLLNHNIRFTDYVKDGQTHEGLYSIAGYPELSQPMPEGLSDAEKTKRKNDARYIREDAKLALDYWKAKNYIKGYRDYRDGNRVIGFEIALTQSDLDAWGKSR